MNKITLIVMALAVAACNTAPLDDGYQIGDGLNMAADGMQRLTAAIDQYCSVAPNDPARNAALTVIRIRYPDIPEDGICTRLKPAGQ